MVTTWGVFHLSANVEGQAFAPDHRRSDYIDCCGVLHHLEAPDDGLRSLAASLNDTGGMGLMVYAPLGRSGVYPLQHAFNALLSDLPLKEQVPAAKRILKALPEGHPFHRNPHLVDHAKGDAGFYDLLLHSRDRPYTVSELIGAIERAGLACAALVPPAQYDPVPMLPEGVKLPVEKGSVEAMVLFDIFGNSMEPEIRNGDTVLVDQNQKEILAGALYAVGIEDTIMVKRIEKRPNKLVLLSNHKDYLPVLLTHKEAEDVRIIGRVIWICREI